MNTGIKELVENYNKSYINFGFDMCRACLTNKNLHSLFISQNLTYTYAHDIGEKNILNMFTFCTKLDATWNDQYPKHICSDCLDDLIRAYSFSNKCRNSVAKINKLIENTNIKLKIEPLLNFNENLENNVNNIEINEQKNPNRNKNVIDNPSKSKGILELELNKTKQFKSIINSHNSKLQSNYKSNIIYLKTKDLCNTKNKILATKQESFVNEIKNNEITPKRELNENEICSNSKSTNSIKINKIRSPLSPIEECQSLSLEYHNNTAEEYNSIECEIEFNNEDYIHNISTEENKSIECETEFSNEDMRHNSSTEEIYYLCEHCKKKFETYDMRYIHIKKYHKFSAHYKCTVCLKKFETSTELHCHEIFHTLTSETEPHERYQCFQCDKIFDKPRKFRDHMNIHSDVYPRNFLCQYCGKRLRNRTNLKEHELHHSDLKPYECQKCKQCFKTEAYLKSHMRVHIEEKKYLCEHCDQRFSKWHAKRTHIIAYHTTERPYVCKICLKSFKYSGSLTTHMRFHSGEKPFSCSKCDLCFTTNTCLKKHLITHTGERKYPCPVCEKTFGRAQHVRQHMVTHTGERKHKCNVCEKAFTQAHVLRSHMKTHNKILVKGTSIS